MTTTDFYINKVAMTLFLLISLPFQSLADVWQDPVTKVNYEYTVGESEASVKSAIQNTEGTLEAGSPDVTGHVVIREMFTVGGTDYTVTSIGQDAFCNITDMTGVTIPESVVVIDNGAFRGCTGLTSVNIPSSVTKIDHDAFMRCTGLATVILNEGLSSIGFCAFEYCSNLSSVNIPSTVTTIYGHAFHFCYNLGSVTLSEGLERIDLGAFARTSITSVTIPSSVTTIGDGVFGDCANLTDINILSDNAIVGKGVFRGTGWYNNQPDGLLYMGHWLLGYKGPKPEGDIIVEQGTKVIAAAVFYECSGITSVIIPEGVTNIGSQAFYGCTNLKKVSIPNGVTQIGLESFRNCSRLTKVTIPESVHSFGSLAFGGCGLLTCIKIYAQTPPGYYSTVFSYITYSNATLLVPAGTKEAYGAAAGWKNYTSVLQIGDANTDDDVDIGDVTAIINSINDAPAAEFNFDASDVNGDDVIDIGDVTGVINIINK